ncbi:hypothetical protein FIM1_4864 [Kluyveromyces marxianus]|uniref:Uncharacterized protein n=1 Tax=Kluyveromyces marxianus TaxID=4911 RepID=A0ABX6EZY8_KLUMA|nr:hypothetical protein FIM1_4864 [Kluyveromyces marxianus]
MSQIVTDLSTIPIKINEHAGETFLRLRIFAQFQSISGTDVSSTDSIYLKVTNVPGFGGSQGQGQGQTQAQEFSFLIDETIYDEMFIRNRSRRPHRGDILDLRCCYRKYDDVIEIMHLKQVSIADLDALRQFVMKSHDDSAIHSFLH